MRGYIGNAPSAVPFDLSPFYAMMRGAISGLVQAQAADTDHDITLSVGGAMDSTNADWLALDTAITKQIDAAWAVGTDAGGLDTGTVANSTWYYIWLIKNPTSGVVDALFSTSASAPTMPTGYTLKRLVGAVLTNSSANIQPFKAFETAGGGLEVVYNDPIQDFSSTVTTTARTDTISVPTAFSVMACINVMVHDAASTAGIYISNPDHATDLAPSSTISPLRTMRAPSTAVAGNNQLRIRTSATGQIRARGDIASTDTYIVDTVSWEWSRR